MKHIEMQMLMILLNYFSGCANWQVRDPNTGQLVYKYHLNALTMSPTWNVCLVDHPIELTWLWVAAADVHQAYFWRQDQAESDKALDATEVVTRNIGEIRTIFNIIRTIHKQCKLCFLQAEMQQTLQFYNHRKERCSQALSNPAQCDRCKN